MDLQSSLKSKGEYVTQIIHFVGGVKRTFEGVSTSKRKQGQMTKLELFEKLLKQRIGEY